MENLSRFEKASLALGRFTNDREWGKRLQLGFTREVTQRWVKRVIGPRVFAKNISWLVNLNPDRGVVFAANHRSFFDQWSNMLCLFQAKSPWIQRLYFPVRSNFFYEKPGGVFVNYATGLGVMYPPIFRDRQKASLNRTALDGLIACLDKPGSIVGVHPEGRRSLLENPYELLPAQPGVGEIVLKSKPVVVPIFVNGLTNAIPKEISRTRMANGRQLHPIIIVYGKPLDLSEYEDKKPRLALYKKVSEQMNSAISGLMETEKEIRAQALAGDLPDSDPGWFSNLKPDS